MSPFYNLNANRNNKNSNEIPEKNNNFLRDNGKFIFSGVISLLSTLWTSGGVIFFYISFSSPYYLEYFTFLWIIDMAIIYHISFVLSMSILILSIKGILGYKKKRRGENYVTRI
jgi:hypothetical protein